MPPGPPGTIYVVSAEDTSVRLATKLSIFGYLSITSVTFVLTDPHDDIIYYEAVLNLQPGEVATADIQELKPLTIYSVYAYATNSVGDSDNNTVSTFSTRKTLLSYCFVSVSVIAV